MHEYYGSQPGTLSSDLLDPKTMDLELSKQNETVK